LKDAKAEFLIGAIGSSDMMRSADSGSLKRQQNGLNSSFNDRFALTIDLLYKLAGFKRTNSNFRCFWSSDARQVLL
jgi:hypothetical protein